MRVFLDANVLVSAFVARGLCADVLRAVLQKHELISAKVVVRELRHLMRVKFEMPVEVAAEYSAFVERYVTASEPEDVTGLALETNDLLVIGSALGARAEVLITGDKEILGCAPKMPTLQIMSPREFWKNIVLAERS